MRPIDKKQPGEIVQYEDAHGHTISRVIQSTYQPYRDAKPLLVGNLDHYCSYCEGAYDMAALEVEHMKAMKNGGAETDWNNLLLSCKTCNTVKSTNDVGSESHWPHLNNTFMDFIYKEDGRVQVNPHLPELSKTRAQNLYNLVRLGRDNRDATPMDYRWKKRYEAWKTAKRAKDSYLAGKWDAQDVIKMSKLTGCWSIWFTAFEGVDEVRELFISEFAGTCRSCFDPENHYQPIPRNPFNESDPI